MANDVIAAIATAPGTGGIGVIRISGANLSEYLSRLVNKDVVPRVATRARFCDREGDLLDDGLVLFFPSPHSYTGEDVIEAHGHGGPVILQLLLQRCVELGARLAEPGEFTKRAFLNGKLDLAQAEAVADLIGAATAQAARSAQRSLQGEFSQRVGALARELQELRVLVEAGIDFAEENLDLLQDGDVRRRIDGARESLVALLGVAKQGSLLREGIEVVLAGAPNVGKSSLMNRLAGMERSIVTEIPGTTRDVIREAIAIEGVPVVLLDTAGLRTPQDTVEAIGVARAREAILSADMLLWVSDATRPETAIMDMASPAELPLSVPRLHAVNKVDLAPTSTANAGNVLISAKTGQGLASLRRAILRTAGYSGGERLFAARARHVEALSKVLSHLEGAAIVSRHAELAAEELRLAHNALTTITGEFTSDDLLGQIFARFCIGK